MSKIELNNEPFSLKKFFAGFGDFGKVLWVLALFALFTFAKDFLLPKVTRETEIQTVEQYIEAPENKEVHFFGIKISKVGLGVIYEK